MLFHAYYLHVWNKELNNFIEYIFSYAHFMAGLLQIETEYETPYTEPKNVSPFLNSVNVFHAWSQSTGVQPMHQIQV